MPSPVFCPNCRHHDTFERKPDKDVKMEGKVFEEAWACKVCGYIAYVFKGGKDEAILNS